MCSFASPSSLATFRGGALCVKTWSHDITKWPIPKFRALALGRPPAKPFLTLQPFWVMVPSHCSNEGAARAFFSYCVVQFLKQACFPSRNFWIDRLTLGIKIGLSPCSPWFGVNHLWILLWILLFLWCVCVERNVLVVFFRFASPPTIGKRAHWKRHRHEQTTTETNRNRCRETMAMVMENWIIFSSSFRLPEQMFTQIYAKHTKLPDLPQGTHWKSENPLKIVAGSYFKLRWNEIYDSLNVDVRQREWLRKIQKRPKYSQDKRRSWAGMGELAVWREGRVRVATAEPLT